MNQAMNDNPNKYFTHWNQIVHASYCLISYPLKKKHSSPFPASKVRVILFHPAKTVIDCHLMHQNLRFLFLQQRPGVSVKMGDAVGCTHFPMFPKESKTGIVSPNNKDEQMNIKTKSNI